MEKQSFNPLANYFRQPAIYLKLPSTGRWWPQGSLELSESQELPIYPMSTKDEILIRTPDALLNGQGVVDVIQSCCPAIKNAWHTPAVDVDAILVAIRIASYGNNMDFDSTCPHCKHSNTHQVELGNVLSDIRCPDYSKLLFYRDLKIRLRPQSYFFFNRANMSEFSEQRIVDIMANESIPAEEKSKRVTEFVGKIYNLGMDICVNHTDYIEMPNGDRVTDIALIAEFYQNAESALINSLRDTIAEITSSGKISPLNLKCANCTEKYQIDLAFDYSNFFGDAS